jgi:hypothetical protein
MPWSPIRVIKQIYEVGGIVGLAMIATAIILLIVGVVWAAHHDHIF